MYADHDPVQPGRGPCVAARVKGGLWAGLAALAVATASLMPVRAVAVTLIPTGAVWRYWDQTNYPGDAWRTLAFDDSAWSNGPAVLGFGDLNGLVPATVLANNRQTTSYFRHRFTVTNAAAYTQLALSLMRDDGAVLWLNGTEIWRHNMPAGEILPDTWASVVVGGTDESTWWTTNILSTHLTSGTNLLAAEVHQHTPQTSTDVGFNFAVEGLNDNLAPIITVPADMTRTRGPTNVVLAASAQDDGRPLPADTGNPDPGDPNKLRWQWSVVSVPAASTGVAWSGATSGEAFTYAGSSNAPGTVFTCSATATLDAVGLYELAFTAQDGEKTTSRTVRVLITTADAYRDAGYRYLSPVPGAEHCASGGRLLLVRFTDVSPTNLTNLANFITVNGGLSGLHAGLTRIASDGRTVIFESSTDYAYNELVTVTLNPRPGPGAGGTVAPYQYQFAVGGFLTTAVAGVVSARGDNAPDEAKEMAFDNLTQTKWLDFIVPNGTSNFSWIQYVYPATDTRVVNRYAITSADDAPERDPRDWRFYGVDAATNLVLLDTQSNQTFSGRFQEKTFTFTNVLAYRGYRLEIARVNDPVTASAVQLAELDLIEPGGSLLREYWTGITGTDIASLTGSPNYPNTPSGQDQRPSFEAPTDWADDYGTRMRGYITAPATGTFVFWIATDDAGELWLSTNTSPAAAVRIAYVPGWTTAREWTKYPEQKSAAIPLVAGQKYYVEALQKEGGGGDNLAVGWAKPGQATTTPSEVVPGSVLTPWGVSPAPAGAARASIPGGGGSGAGLLAASIRPNGVSIPSDFPVATITANSNPAPGYIFLENAGQGGQYYTMILENDGSPVWYRRGGGREFKVQQNGSITWSAFTATDKNFNYLRDYYAGNGHATDDHELEVLPNGGYLVLGFHDQGGIDLSRYISGGNTSATVHATALQEFTAAGDLILQFRAWDHFDIADVQPWVENPLAGNVRFSHMNAIDVDADGNLLISSRHISEITKIDRDTGEIVWRLGGAHSDFTFVNDPLNGFWAQHDITGLGSNRYLLFDNGNNHSPSVSRAVEYQLDLTNHTATMVWQFRNDPDRYTFYMGNAQRLSNGNTLINFVLSGYPKVTEVDPAGAKRFEMSLAPGSDLYRAFRFPWDGVVAAPYLILENYPDNVTLIFNKFGDRSVDYYRIYGGTSPNPTGLLATSKTTLKRLYNVTNGAQNYFRVTAVSTNGVESGYSNEENVYVNIVKPGENMVLNGAFAQGSNNWTLAIAGTASAVLRLTNGAALVDLSAAGTQVSDVSLRQAGLKLLQGREYVLSFDAWAVGGTRTIEARVGQNASPFATYKLATPSLTIISNRFVYPFVMTNTTDFEARLAFNCGASTRDVYVDNVDLWMVSLGDFNRDRAVNYADLDIMTDQWLRQGAGLAADLNGDGKVDFKDFAILGDNWTAGGGP